MPLAKKWSHHAGERRWVSLRANQAPFADQFDERDMWIAATALTQHQPLPVVTNDFRHFTPMSKRFGLLWAPRL
jgi:predicted nucleic acid-binding protein